MKIKVKVIPNAKKQRIEQTNEGFKIYLTVPAQEGRANKNLVEVLAEYFDVKKYNITIVQGETQREKVIQIDQ